MTTWQLNWTVWKLWWRGVLEYTVEERVDRLRWLYLPRGFIITFKGPLIIHPRGCSFLGKGATVNILPALIAGDSKVRASRDGSRPHQG